MFLMEYNLFQAHETILHDYIWKGPDFVNMNSVISSNTETMNPFLLILSLLSAITVHKNYSGISMNVVTLSAWLPVLARPLVSNVAM